MGTKGEINNHLDKLQEDLLNELSEAVTIVTRQTSELMVSLDEKQKELSEYKRIFSIISPISCSVSSNLYDVFTFLTIFSRTVKSLHSL
jgi:hypothetical protein